MVTAIPATRAMAIPAMVTLPMDTATRHTAMASIVIPRTFTGPTATRRTVIIATAIRGRTGFRSGTIVTGARIVAPIIAITGMTIK
jgi:hypothetical protein